MSRKVALLIGVSEYGEGLPPLSAAPNDVAALQRVLEHPQMAGFDQVDVLIGPGLVEMQDAILQLFADCARDDLLLLYFSGHGITDDLNRLYLANCQTSKDNFRARAVPASFIQQESINCYTKRQVIILDCCYSGAFKEGWQAKAAGVDLRRELGAEGRVVLASSTATQTSFQQDETGLSLYTQYLIEGIETGAADTDRDGKIFVRELHDYAKVKVQAARPTMQPEILLDQQGFDILLSRAPLGDRTLDFRRLVEQAASEGEISSYRRDILRMQQQEWGLTEDAAEAIIHSVLEPFRRRLANLGRFRTALEEEVNKQFPLPVGLETDLRDWQRQVLGLEDVDVAEIWQQLTAEKEAAYAVQVQQQQEEARRSAAAQQEQETWRAVVAQQDQEAALLLDDFDNVFSALDVAVQQDQEAALLRQQEIERLQQQEAERQRQAAERASRRTHPPVTVRPWTRQQVLKGAGFSAIALMGTGIVAFLQKLFPGSTNSKPSEPAKPSEPIKSGEVVAVATPKYTQPSATAAKLAGLPLWTVDFETVTVDARGENPQRTNKQAKFVKEDLGNGISLDLVAISGGSFTMGSPAGEKDRFADEGPQRSVKVSAFALGRYAVTQAQYQAIMGTNPANFKGSNRPVEMVSWTEAMEFCQRLSKRTSRTYDLPSEAEWEYACRAGTTTPFYFGETITTRLANYDGNSTYGDGPKGTSQDQTIDVGSFPPNAWGLYDMHGNVWEWCLDQYRASYKDTSLDGRAWVTTDLSKSRVLRGGSWFNLPEHCRSARRYYLIDGRHYFVGFRVVLRAA